MSDITRSVSPQTLLRTAEPLWVASLGVQLIAGGGLLLPGFIRLLGRGGAVETVEWAVYMSALFVFPLLVLVTGWLMPHLFGDRAAGHVRQALVLLMLAEFAVYAVWRATPSLVVAAGAASLAGIALLSRSRAKLSRTELIVAAACGMAGCMAAGTLVYWGDPTKWIAGSPLAIAVLVVFAIVVAAMLRGWIARESDGGDSFHLAELLPVAILVAFSFRTFPVVEFYHWGFFIGPIEQIRQGGALLWDTPSQYGFLSILLPSLLPGNAWQSFWFFQAIVYAIVACLMYLAIRRLAPGWWSVAGAFIVTFTVLFFRPRTASLILPAQMTPAAGPFRFIWCFAMLAFLMSWHTRQERWSSLRFALTGTAIWIVAILWSAETAIYVTAMWFPAYLIHTLQERGGAWFIVKRAAIPFAALAVAVFAVAAVYGATTGFDADLHSYLDYVLLYSRGGFGALPIDPTGTIWYLVLCFLIVSTILVIRLRRDLLDSRIVVFAAAWGTIWSVSSYFTGRSHPVNLVALIPLLLYVIVICMRLRPFGSDRASFAMAAVMLPLLVMPAVVTAGHQSFPRAVSEPQLAPSRFTEQVDVMDPDLQELLATAGAEPYDSFVLLGDGRLMLQGWGTPGSPGLNASSTRSWLPKPFEIVGSLGPERRQTYFERNAQSSPNRAWLIQSRTLSPNGGNQFLDFLASSRREERRHENAKWIVSLMGPAGSASN